MWFLKFNMTDVWQGDYWVFRDNKSMLGYQLTRTALFAEAFGMEEVEVMRQYVSSQFTKATITPVECRMCDELRKVMGI